MEYGALTLIPIVFIIVTAIVTRKSFESLLAGSVIASIIMHGKGFFLPWVDILLETLSPEQVCGTVRNIGREGEEARIYTLAGLRDVQADMFTTVFIGNRSTKRIGDRMVTPRGYARERGTAETGGKTGSPQGG